jgi:hypothetical protein
MMKPERMKKKDTPAPPPPNKMFTTAEPVSPK